MSDNSVTFAPLPARAIADHGLSALDLRVLAALAVHDRFGANGIGCFASHPRLAKLVGCHLKSLSRSLSELTKLGYIEAKPQPLNKRLRVYRVIYSAADRAIMKGKIGNGPVTNVSPKGNEAVPEAAPIGNRDFKKNKGFQRVTNINILGKTYKRLGEASNRHSHEAAPPYGVANLLRESGHLRDDQREAAMRLREIEIQLKTVNGQLPTTDQFEELLRAQHRCWEIEERLSGEQVGYWAKFLAGEINNLVESVA